MGIFKSGECMNYHIGECIGYFLFFAFGLSILSLVSTAILGVVGIVAQPIVFFCSVLTKSAEKRAIRRSK